MIFLFYSLTLLWAQVPVVVRCRRDRAPGQVGQVGAHDAGLQEGRHQASRALVGARQHCQTEDEQGQRPVAGYDDGVGAHARGTSVSK